MRLSLSRMPHLQQRTLEQNMPDMPDMPNMPNMPDTADTLGLVYGCEEEGCGKLALQSCLRCGQRFCTDHIRAWERDLPVRGLKLPPPDWYCYQCRTTF